MRRPTLTVAALLFGSGFAALVYQTAWERLLRLVFGASTAASSAVLGIFLAGLGVGGVWLGKRAEQSARPLVLYGNLEAGVAVTAALTPFLVDAAAKAYLALGGSSALGAGGATIVRLLLATLVLGPPVVLMGGTLPAAARAVESEGDTARRRVAVLYAANTSGAVAGALLATFLLFELFGIRLALWTATLLNLLVAMLARQAGRALEPVPTREAPAEPEVGVVASRAGFDLLRTRLVYGVALAVGFAFLSLEIVWYRVLGPILGGSSFTFGLILAVALAGIGIGSFLYTRRDEARPATLALLGWTVALEAAFVALPLALGDRIALLAAYARTASGLGFSALILSWTLITSFVVLPAAIVSGYQFPVLFALLGRGRPGVARQVGLAYAFNTVGSIVGALSTGFVLLPRLGAVGTWKLVAVVLVVIALAVVVLALRSGATGGRGWLAAAATLAVVALLLARSHGPTAVSRHAPIGAGRVPIANADRNQVKAWMQNERHRLLWERDGVESAVGVSSDDGIAFIVNGKADGSVVLDRGTQALLGILPVLLHPAPKSAFVLGLGTGMSAGWLSSVPGVEQVDVAELEPAIVDVARACHPANQNVLDRPNVHVLIGDGREHLTTRRQRYDLIVSEPSNPYRAGIASLFTREFYQIVASRLAPGGVFGQWVQAYEIDARTLRIVLATLRDVFPEVEAWQTQSGDLLLVATREPLEIDADLLRRRTAQEPFATVLPRAALVQDAEGVLARFVASRDVMAGVAGAFDPPINTDDSMVLDYAFARQVGTKGTDLATELMLMTQPRGIARPRVRGAVDWERVEEQRGRAWLIVGDMAPKLGLMGREAAARSAAVEAGCRGDIVTALKLWQSQSRAAPRDLIETYVLAQGLAQERKPEATALAEQLGAAGYLAEKHLVLARYVAGTGKRSDAMEHLFSAVTELRARALHLCNAPQQVIDMMPVLSRGQPELSARAARVLLEQPFSVYVEERRRLRTGQNLAFASGDVALCVASLGKQLDQPWWDEAFLAQRADCLERAGHPLAARAKDDLADYLDATSGRIQHGVNLPPLPDELPAPSAAPADGD